MPAGGSSSGSSESDMDEVAEAQGAWINNWAQQELGADLEQLQEMVVAGQGLPFDQMDEGSSSSEEEEEEGEEDEEQGHFALGLDGDGEAGFGAGDGGGAAAAAVAAGPRAPPVQVSAVETLLRAVTRRNTRARNRLRVPLSRPVGANIALVKLISQVCRCLLRLLGCLLTRPCDTVLVVISLWHLEGCAPLCIHLLQFTQRVCWCCVCRRI
jgi:hypothetical protein